MHPSRDAKDVNGMKVKAFNKLYISGIFSLTISGEIICFGQQWAGIGQDPAINWS